MAKPLDEFGNVLYPEIASSDTTTSKGSANKIRPNPTIRTNGWDSGEIPTCNQFNFQFDLLDQWIKHLEGVTDSVLSAVFPVGSRFFTEVLDGYPAVGTWELTAQGRMLLGAGTGTAGVGVNAHTETFSAGTLGGEYSHIITELEMPSHNHPLKNGTGGDYTNSILGGSGSSPNLAGQDSAASFVSGSNLDLLMQKTGGSQPMSLMPPYEVVYIYRRVS